MRGPSTESDCDVPSDSSIKKTTSDPKTQQARLVEEVNWLRENFSEKITTASHIFGCNRCLLSKAYHRAQNPNQNECGEINTLGGHNKILTEAQEEAIFQYCHTQWQMGLGAKKQMVYGAIKNLREKEEKREPSWVWFANWLKKSTVLHSLKTKPIERARLESHTEEEV